MSVSIVVPGAGHAAAPRRRQPRLPATWLLVAAAAVAVIGAGGLFLVRREAADANRYVTAAVTRGTVTQSVNSSGTVNPVTIVQVGSYVSGVIRTITCDFNTRVKAGQLCARIDPRPYQTTVDQEVASLATARAQVAKDRANLDHTAVVAQRDVGLLGRGVVSQETAETSASNHAQAVAQVMLDEAGVAQHEAQLRSARINLGYADIVSPVSGTVVSRNVTPGQTVAASFQTPTLFLIATDLTQMQVDTNVSEADIGRVAPGQAARFTVTAFPEREFVGTVQQVRQAPQSVQNVITYDVVVAVSNPDLALKPGMTASMRIVTQRRDGVLRVPDQALRYRPAQQRAGDAAVDRPARPGQGERPQRVVWMLRDGQPRPVAVTVGLDDDSVAEITGGTLRDGDQVVLSERGAARATSPQQPAGLAVPRR